MTSLAIAVGAFTLTMALAAGQGARDYADKLISTNVTTQQVMVTKQKMDNAESFTGGGLQEYSDDVSSQGGYAMRMVTQADIDSIAKMPNIASVTPFYSLSTKYIQIEGSNKKYTAQVNSFDSGRTYTLAAGQVPATGTEIDAGGATVPDTYATALGVSPEALIGKKVTITAIEPVGAIDHEAIRTALLTGDADTVKTLTTPRTFTRTVTIRAVVSKGMAVGSGVATAGVTIGSDMARQIAELNTKGTDNYQKYYGADVRVAKGTDPEVVKKELTDKGYGAQTAADVSNVLFTIVNILQGIVIFFGVLALLASVFGIINTQYISVLERTSQIGLMKALGMSGSAISKLFRYEAAWIGFIGGVLGSMLALALGTAMNPWITKQLALGEGNRLLVFVWWQIVALLALLVVIAIVAGWFPARKAAKLDPIEALRTE